MTESRINLSLGRRIGQGDRSFMAEAACAFSNREIFFSNDGEDIEGARSICAGCVVREACLDYALINKEYGVWGGLSEEERNAILGNRKLGSAS